MNQCCKSPYEDLADDVIEIVNSKKENNIKSYITEDRWAASYNLNEEILVTSKGHLTEYGAKTSCAIKVMRLIILT